MVDLRLVLHSTPINYGYSVSWAWLSLEKIEFTKQKVYALHL